MEFREKQEFLSLKEKKKGKKRKERKLKKNKLKKGLYINTQNGAFYSKDLCFNPRTDPGLRAFDPRPVQPSWFVDFAISHWICWLTCQSSDSLTRSRSCWPIDQTLFDLFFRISKYEKNLKKINSKKKSRKIFKNLKTKKGILVKK